MHLTYGKVKTNHRKPKLDHARCLRGIYFIDPKDEEFKGIMNNDRRNFEIPMPAAMPCKTPITAVETFTAVLEKARTYACVVEADESMRIRLEGVPCRYHEDHVAAKGKIQ